MKPLFALIDCNNFFVSCERIFRPDLQQKPVVVLSSNDGCVVARSNEAKDLGIPMGAPAFKYERVFRDNGVVKFSGNFDLYGDISRRITQTLATITPRLEVYSVDESFLDISQLPITDYEAWGAVVRQQILQWIGVPVSIGIAPTKTLAKLASERAKHSADDNGVLYIKNSALEQLKVTPIESVWGIGHRLAPALRALGIVNAGDFAALTPKLARYLVGSVHGEQLQRELNGQSCLPLQPLQQSQKSIFRSRTFGADTADAYAIEAAIASFATKAAMRLRQDRHITRRIGVFISTDKRKPGFRSFFQERLLKQPTNDTGLIVQNCIELLQNFFIPHLPYHRAGVALNDLQPEDALQTDIFGDIKTSQHTRSLKRMQALDGLNSRFGKGTIRYATEDLGDAWQPKGKIRSPRYTTHWHELPKVKIA